MWVAVSAATTPLASGQPASVLPLEVRGGSSPFHEGEQWDIQGDATVFSTVTRITILDVTHWPWVRVRQERDEMWLNFDHVVLAKSVAMTK